MALHLCLLIGQFVVLHFKTVGKEIITFFNHRLHTEQTNLDFYFKAKSLYFNTQANIEQICLSPLCIRI